MSQMSILDISRKPAQPWKNGPLRAASSDPKKSGLQPLWLASAEIG